MWRQGDPEAWERLPWKRRGEEPDWMAEELSKHKVLTPAPNEGLIGKGQGAIYGSITREDVNVWQQETYKTAVEGSRVFHSGDRLKSTIAVSCDMCHPDSRRRAGAARVLSRASTAP